MDARLTLIGLAAFTASGALYLVSGIRSGDAWVIWGSVVWLVGMGFFIAAVWRSR